MSTKTAKKPQTTQGLSQGQLIRKRFFGHTAAMVALGVLAALFVLIYSSIGIGKIPGWWQYGYAELYPITNETKPTFVHLFNWGDHPFGQDRTGGDMFAKTMRGAQQSVFVMVVIGSIACVFGVVFGALAGYYRGAVEMVLMRLAEMIAITPMLVLAALLGKVSNASEFGRNNSVLILSLLLGCLIWFSLARLVRAEFLSLREREFVDAARIAGATDNRIIFKHVLPNAVGVIIVNTTLLMSEAILLESALSYLGFGIQPPDVSLGRLIVENREAFSTRPWLFWWPGLFIVIICLCVNFIGDGLRDAFDPRQKKFSSKGAVVVDHPELDEMDALPPVIRARPDVPGRAAPGGPPPGPNSGQGDFGPGV